MAATVVDCPLGKMLITANASAITSIRLMPFEAPALSENTITKNAVKQIAEYFAGQRQDFQLSFELEGTEFQKKVWAELVKIPFGEAISYAELAKRIGQPTASRAVGGANGRNPACIVVPCHRVIAADGTLGGFGYGLEKKAWLLRLEGYDRFVTT
jgi:methylated-DNA-[protein]-cysteine S-methyltransferase